MSFKFVIEYDDAEDIEGLGAVPVPTQKEIHDNIAGPVKALAKKLYDQTMTNDALDNEAKVAKGAQALRAMMIAIQLGKVEIRKV